MDRIRQLERELKKAQSASTRAMEARRRLPGGSSRARVTSANARWARAAEHRDRIAADLERERRIVWCSACKVCHRDLNLQDGGKRLAPEEPERCAKCAPSEEG